MAAAALPVLFYGPHHHLLGAAGGRLHRFKFEISSCETALKPAGAPPR